jgi:delta24-sterol reductase
VNHGYQALYADCFQTKQEFRTMFDHELYDRLREKYDCIGRLPDIYDKVSRHARK